MATPSGKAIDAAYLLKQLQGYDEKVASVKYNPKFQVTEMPTASADNVGVYLQYLGETDTTYTNGYFYKCVKNSTAEGDTYAWEAVTQSAPEYSIKKLDNPSSTDYAATYRLTKDEVEIGAEINIPKDFFVVDASVGIVTDADKQPGGKFETDTRFSVGDAYIELDVALQDKSEPKPVYINVSSLVDVYTAGDGISIDTDDNNKISVNLAEDGGLVFDTSDENIAINVGDGIEIEATGHTVKVKTPEESGLIVDTDGVSIDFEDTDIDFDTEWT